MRRRFLLWVAEHDDSWLFTVLYIGLAVVLSIAISLFWLVAVVAAHGVLEWFALERQGIRDRRLGRVLWHLKLDIALVLFALWLGLYVEVLFGLAGLGAAARTGAQATARFVAWQRAIRGVLLTVDDAAQVARAVVARQGNNARNGGGESDSGGTRPPWRQPWSQGDKFSVAFGAVWAVLILAAPMFTDHTLASALATMAVDLHPWPLD